VAETTTETGTPWRERAAGLAKTGTLGVGVLLAAVLVAMLNYLGWKYHARLDWTASRLYSLSEKTANVLAGLGRDVEVVVFIQPGDELYEPTRELLTRYEAASSRLGLRFLDAAKNPIEAQQVAQRFDVKTASVVFAAGDDRQVVQRDQLADFDYSGMQFGAGPEVKAFKGERLFTAALVDLGDPRRPRVRFTTGHGEHRLDDLSPAGLGEAQRLLKDDNFELEEWASMGAAAVPEGTDLLVVAGPQSSFLPPELAAFSAYLDRGGRMLVMLDPVVARAGRPDLLATGLEAWLAEWGVEVGRNVVVDPSNPLPFFGAETLFVTGYGTHPATRSLSEGGLAVLISLAGSVGAGQAPPGLRVTELLRSTAEGWGETDLADPRRDDADLAGPVPLAVAVERESAEGEEDAAAVEEEAIGGEESGEGGAASAPAASPAGDEKPPAARLAVFGDSDFATDRLLGANVANGVLLADTLNWLVERETLLGIPAKEPERVRLALTAGALRSIYALALLGLPALGIACGVVVYTRRRR
jgi:hypothetical protein